LIEWALRTSFPVSFLRHLHLSSKAQVNRLGGEYRGIERILCISSTGITNNVFNLLGVDVPDGAPAGPELDSTLAKADGIECRLPYNSDPIVREKINRCEMEHLDLHLIMSQVAAMAWQGFCGGLDTAIIEVTSIRPDGALIPSSSVGTNKTWLERVVKNCSV
jgi:Acetyl-CoA hydrolase/transferase N-terminal domain